MAAALSFNAVQDELDLARQAIRDGAFYDVYCLQKLALMDSLQKLRAPQFRRAAGAFGAHDLMDSLQKLRAPQ